LVRIILTLFGGYLIPLNSDIFIICCVESRMQRELFCSYQLHNIEKLNYNYENKCFDKLKGQQIKLVM
jgi:hypothetical protein